MGWNDSSSGGQGLDNLFGVGGGDPTNPDRSDLRGFGGQARGNYGADTAALSQQQQYLQGLANGQNSVSALQLRQALQQQLAQQQAMAAGAAPQNQAMAARNAAMNMGQASYGMAGQQAAAGLQERNQANEALAQLNLGARGQDVQGILGAYGTTIANPQKTYGPILGGAAGGLASYIASDRRLKTDVKDGGDDAKRTLEALHARVYRYKDEDKHGKGEQFGVMAQDLEKTPLKSAVIDTPAGKMVHGGKAALASLGLAAELHRRLSKLEKSARGGKDDGDEDDR